MFSGSDRWRFGESGQRRMFRVRDEGRDGRSPSDGSRHAGEEISSRSY